VDIYYKVHMLDGLDQLSIENLQAGRITCSATAHAVRYAEKSYVNFAREKLGGTMGGSSSDRYLADVLNDMFEVAKFKMKEAERTAGPRCVKCGRSFDDHDDEACPPGNKMIAVGQKRAYVVMAEYDKMLTYAVGPEGIAVWKLRSLALHSIEENGIGVAFSYYQTPLTPNNHIALSKHEVESAMRDYYRTRALKGQWDWLCNKCGQRFSNEQVHAARGSGTPACLNCGTEMIRYKEAVAPDQPAAEDECPGCHNGTLEKIGDDLREMAASLGSGPKKPKKKFTLDDLKKVDWMQMESDVRARIELLSELAHVSKRNSLIDKITEDLILPNLRLLAEFCENVEIEEDNEDDKVKA
jgi:predicted  nucleic acid-binding Zn-ribbon protein